MACLPGPATGHMGRSISTSISTAPWGFQRFMRLSSTVIPGLAFLLDTNPEIANLLVAAHVFGHVDFFKNNLCFADTNRRMVNDAVAHALRVTAQPGEAV